MTSLSFLTLFLGLAAGVQPVTVAVDGAAARVEVWVDGASCGERGRPPWRFRCDFGDELAPHRLEAVAYDEEGAEIARQLQIVNLAPRQAEAELVVERDEAGRAAALRLVWESVSAAAPSSLLVSFDDVPLELPAEVAPPLRVPLPEHDPRQLHFASAELTFPDGAAARAEAAFGGAFGETVRSEGTAVPLLLRGRPSPAETAARLLVGRPDGTPAPPRPLAFEGGEADLVAVVEASALAELAVLRERFETSGGGGREAEAAAGLVAGDRFSLVDPVPRRQAADDGDDDGYDLFVASPPRFASQGGLVWQLTHVAFPAGAPQHLADAVAMAAMQAAAGSRPRAVLLVLGPDARDGGRYTPAQVRRFLDRLRVPLTVWWLEREGRELDRRERREAAAARSDRLLRKRAFAEAWGGVEEIRGFRGLVAAARRLRERVGDQRMLWIEGLHLPAEVALAQGTAGESVVQLVGVEATRGDEVIAASEIELPDGVERLTDLEAEGRPLGEGRDGSAEGEGVASLGAAADAADTVDEAAVTGAAAPALAAGGGPLLLAGADLETFRDSLRVDLVEVETMVTDRAGRPLAGLTREDFRVLEDGRPVELTHFAAVQPDTPLVDRRSGDGPDSGSASTPVAATPVHLVLYLDEAQMLPTERNRMLARLGPLLDGLPEGARVQLLVHDAGLDVRAPFTADRGAVLAALRAAAGGSGGANLRAEERRRAVRQVEAAESMDDALRAADLYASQRLVEVKATVRHLAALVDSLAPLPGRKAVVYLGSGLPAVAGQEAFLAVERAFQPGAEFGRTGHPALRAAAWDATGLYTDLARRAGAARVTVYAIDAAGRRGAASFDVEQGEYSAGVGLDAEIGENVARPLQLLAQGTGGLAVTGTERIEPFLERIAADFASYYVLGYPAPAAGVGDAGEGGAGVRDDMRRIEVRVDRPGAAVRHRRAYRHRGAGERLADAVLAALAVPPAAGGLGVDLAFGRPAALPDGSFRVPLELRIPFAELVLVPSGSRWVNDLEVLVAVESAGGERSPLRRAPVSIDLSAAQAEAARGVFTVTVPLRMEAGEQRVAVGVRDAVTGGEGVAAGALDPAGGREPLRTLTAERRTPGEEVIGTDLLRLTSPGERKLYAFRGRADSLLVPTSPSDPFPAGLLDQGP